MAKPYNAARNFLRKQIGHVITNWDWKELGGGTGTYVHNHIPMLNTRVVLSTNPQIVDKALHENNKQKGEIQVSMSHMKSTLYTLPSTSTILQVKQIQALIQHQKELSPNAHI